MSQELTNLLRAIVFCPPGSEDCWGRPGLILGEPGTGKTKLVSALAKTFGLHFRRLSPAETGEGQFGVTGVPGVDGKLHYYPPYWVDEFEHGGILFIDEITCTPFALQAPILGLSQLRVLGDHTFNSRTRILSAGNAVEDAAGGTDLANSVLNRFGHFTYDGYDANAWAMALIAGFDSTTTPLNAEAEEARVLAAWPEQIASARGLVSGFIMRQTDLLKKKPPIGSKDRAWPSQRTVHYACEMMASARIQGLTEWETDTLMGAYVGDAWVSAFRAWLSTADMPVPADVLDGKAVFTHDVRRLDRTLAFFNSAASLLHPRTCINRKDRSEKLWELIGTVLDQAPDVAVPAARALINAQDAAVLLKGDRATKIRGRLLQLMEASGILK